MTFFSMSQRQVPTKYELQWSIVAIVRPMQLFFAEKLGFDMLTVDFLLPYVISFAFGTRLPKT